MKIVVLDGKTLNPGDLSWETLERFGELTVYDRTPTDQVVARSIGAELLLTNKTPLSAEAFSQLPDLRYIGVLATGYNIVDVVAAARHGVTVTNVPTYGTHSVAQMVFALLLELCHHVGAHSEAVRKGAWSQSVDFCFWNYPLVELAGKTMGIIGFGRIGRQTAQVASALGMRILAAEPDRENPPELEDFSWAEIPELLAAADVVSLHCPLFPETEGLINRENIERMKRSAFLINTSRGGLVVDADLAEALDNDRIAGAGLDVLSSEPPDEDNPLLRAKNCLITPHISWATKEARARLMATAIQNVEAFLAGRPVNVVRS
ncbi:MAG: D-2-hydroxyacid dehydrogenase [Candidatus Latescibacteria bacterium]|nr:D-2-hydroxyacid dehydrogenase [Candidatus Latescibacterota bacterium]